MKEMKQKGYSYSLGNWTVSLNLEVAPEGLLFLAQGLSDVAVSGTSHDSPRIYFPLHVLCRDLLDYVPAFVQRGFVWSDAGPQH